MKSSYSVFAVYFLILMSSSIALADDWVKTSDPPMGVNPFKVELGQEKGNIVQFLLETSGIGLFMSTDLGTTWENIGLTGVGITGILDRWSIVYDGEHLVSASDGVHKTTDGGTTWQKYTTGIEGLYITCISQASTNINPDYAVGTVGDGVFKSSDGGETWQQLGTGLENITVISLEWNPDIYELLAVTQDEGVYKFNFLNNTWMPINDGNPSLFNNTSIAVNHPDELLLTNFDSGVYSSPSDPVFWEVEINFPFANDIVVTPDGKVFVSSFGNGVKLRISEGNWIDFSVGIPVDPDGFRDIANLAGLQLWFPENANTEQYLWAAYTPLHLSMTPGVYRTVNPVTDVEGNLIVTPEDFRLEQNYPNPFNPSTTISYSIPNNSFVTIKVYDVLGNEIAELVNEEKSVGVHEITFNASNLSTGTYFYQLQAINTSAGTGESFVEARKMVLMK